MENMVLLEHVVKEDILEDMLLVELEPMENRSCYGTVSYKRKRRAEVKGDMVSRRYVFRLS